MYKKIWERLLCILFVLSIGFLISLNDRRSVKTSSVESKTIVIDAGHGEPDGGAVGQSGILESEINLSVAKRIESKLKEQGFGVIMTRSGTEGIYKTNDAAVRVKKREDLNERVRIANESGADLFLSIHMNYFGEKKYSGPQVFYAASSENAKCCAEAVMGSIREIIGSHCTREIKPVDKGIFILEKIKVPAVLVECGFLSNPDEEKLLISEEYQEKIAESIAKGTAEYLSAKK